MFGLIKKKVISLLGLISKKKMISTFAKELAEKQKKADYWYYIKEDQNMSSYVLQHADEIKELASKLGIVKEVYNQAYKIYDFRNSGKKDFKPNLDELSNI